MSRLEFIERLTAPSLQERWLVRDPDCEHPRVAWLFHGEDREALERLREQAQRWIGFVHPRVSRVIGESWVNSSLVLHVDDDRGPTLAAAPARLADVPIDRERWSVAQIIGIADGLTAMAQHAPGFGHPPINPESLFVDAAGHAKLRARLALVAAGFIGPRRGVGTLDSSLPWLSPEQCHGERSTPASDVFSLASNLRFALTGEPPFDAEDQFEVMSLVRYHPAPAVPTLAPELGRTIERAHAKHPDDRIPDPAAFAAELRACVPDAADYDVCISDLIGAWWPIAPPAYDVIAHDLGGDRCQRAWDELSRGVSDDIRHCTTCDKEVVYSTADGAVRPLIFICMPELPDR